MKKVAIVCDNYKLAEFRKRLTDQAFSFKETSLPDGKQTTSLIIETEEENIPKIQTICEETELHFKGLKN